MFEHWRAAPADDDLRRGFTAPDLDDRGWAELPTGHHWGRAPGFDAGTGSVLYRHRFESSDPGGDAAGRRDWLVFDGIFYTSDVWLDGSYLGDTEGYFFPHGFEVTEHLRGRSDHLLALDVACLPQTDRARKRNLTGVFQHWDLIDRGWSPGGIWRPVRLERSGPVRIRHHRILCGDATAESATVSVRLVLDSTDARTVGIVATASRDGREVTDHRLSHPLAAGENQVEFTFGIDQPDLWWPWSRGDQPLYDIDVSITADDESLPSDRVRRRVGMRSVSVDDWVFSINGERLFVKGANQGPTRFALGEATPDELVRDVELAKDAGLDFLRLHAHISRPEIYDAADEAGLLIWQDLPLQWGYHRSVRAQARRQTREAVDLLASHPSVFVWCGHNEPMAIDIAPDALADPVRRTRLFAKAFLHQQLPTWNRSVLDHSIVKVLRATDPSRPAIAHSGILPHLPLLDGTDSHWYFGWYHGETSGFAKLLRAMPRTARFVSEFGAQAAPPVPPWSPDEAGGTWPDLDWIRLGERYAVQAPIFERVVPPADHPDYERWAAATQRYQADLLKAHIEALRRIKYRPAGGFAMFCFADSGPGITWSVLDHEREPKAGFEALVDACRPVIVVADPLPVLRPGQRLRLDVHVVNDRTIAITDMVASAHLTWESSEEVTDVVHQHWQGDAAADDVVLVGTVVGSVPAGATHVCLDLELTGTGPDGEPVIATNRYRRLVGDPANPGELDGVTHRVRT